jgi:hypothetical protein
VSQFQYVFCLIGYPSAATNRCCESLLLARAKPFKEGDSTMDLSMQDISRIEVSSSANTTPRSDASPSDPSGSSFDVTGSEMTGSILSDDDF